MQAAASANEIDAPPNEATKSARFKYTHFDQGGAQEAFQQAHAPSTYAVSHGSLASCIIGLSIPSTHISSPLRSAGKRQLCMFHNLDSLHMVRQVGTRPSKRPLALFESAWRLRRRWTSGTASTLLRCASSLRRTRRRRGSPTRRSRSGEIRMGGCTPAEVRKACGIAGA
eukprot:943176-Pleurochrysis_carterae.AAC.3